MRTADDLVTGVEALLRRHHPQRGLVLPDTTVRIAEQNGLIGSIGEWVLERACTDRTRWAAQQPGRPLDLSVNVSARQLLEPGLCGAVERILTSTGMDPTALVLKLTENVCIDDPQRARTVLHDLRGLGVRFVASLHHDRTALAMAAAVTDLAHVLGMMVTAEGVETEQQHHDVVSIGCDLSQGFRHGHPVSAGELEGRLEAVPGPPRR